MNKVGWRASLIELWNRNIKYVKTKDYWQNGDDDNYSLEIERVIMNSPTAVRVADLMSKYIAGMGVTNDVVVYDDVNLSDIVKDMANDLTYQGGFYLHRSIKLDADSGNFITDKIEVIDYHKCRKGDSDDSENEGKIWFGDFSDRGYGSKEKDWYYPFSTNQNVIKAQILSDSKKFEDDDIAKKIKHYRGQVIYVNTTPKFMYAISPFDSVYNDMDTEYRISLYGNKIIREGFLGKTMVLVKGLNEEESESMRDKVQGWLGAENSSNIFFSAIEDLDKISEAIHIQKIETDYNDDMFTKTEERIRRNILGSGANVPEGLLYLNEGALFSGSGEQIKQLKQMYYENTEYYRKLIEKTLARLGFDSVIITLDELDYETGEE